VNASLAWPGLLRSEWTKLTTIRSTWWCAGVYAVVVLGLGWLAAAVTDRAPRADIAVTVALTGFGVGQLVLVVLGVLAGAGEFTTGMAVASFTTVPRRRRLLAAKVLVLGLAVAVLSAVLALGCLLAARVQTVVADGGVPLTEAGVLRALGLQVAWAVLVTVVSVALGTVLPAWSSRWCSCSRRCWPPTAGAGSSRWARRFRPCAWGRIPSWPGRTRGRPGSRCSARGPSPAGCSPPRCSSGATSDAR
jgi:hypothetical protein